MTIISYTNRFDEKSALGFAQWCKDKRVNFINAPISRKREAGSIPRFRELYVMKEEYLGNIITIN